MIDKPLFKVIDTFCNEEADPETVALDESEFASSLIYCDMDGWYVNCYGEMALLDECGSYDMPFDDRFKLVWDRDVLRALLDGLEKADK